MPPLAIAAGVAAVGTIGGALISSHAQSSAANQAASAEQQATNAQLQLGQQSLAQSRDIYNQNAALLNPYVQRGNVAGESINALLGLPAQAAAAPATTAPHPGTPATGTETGGQGVLGGPNHYPYPSVTGPANVNAPIESTKPSLSGGNIGMATPPTSVPTSATGTPATPTSAVNALSATDAFNNFANSAGMQFQLQQGENAINNGYAANGQLQSGAALKALQGYGQNTALNNYFMPYLGLLGGQQATGAQSAAAVAGVGSNFSNTAANINSQMAGYIGNGADNQANAAIARGQAGAGLGAGIGNALGQFGSSFFQPSSGGYGGVPNASNSMIYNSGTGSGVGSGYIGLNGLGY